MQLIGKPKLQKLKKKNQGNKLLEEAIDSLINDIEGNSCNTPIELKKIRPDADKVHNDGFFFFNIDIHRTMILIEFEDHQATIVWAGSHDEYERTFKNTKATIKKWLKSKGYIE